MAIPRINSTSSIFGTGFMKWVPEKAPGTVGSRRQPGDRQGGGVGGDDRVRGQNLAQLLEDRLLDRIVLDRRLDGDVAIAEALVVGAGDDAGESGARELGTEPTLFDETAEIFLELLNAAASRWSSTSIR